MSQWTRDPAPWASTYIMDFTYLLKEDRGRMRCEHNRNVCALFSEQDSIEAMTEVGLDANLDVLPVEEETGAYLVFAGVNGQ
jgi:hypothetical protein